MTSAGAPAGPKVLDALLCSLEQAAAFNQNVQVPPAVILWPDQASQWERLIPVLRDVLPHLLTLGAFDPDIRCGPAIWIKCVLAGTLPGFSLDQGVVPILYLPGVSRQDLRAVESCPKHLQPLAELQYRGAFWTQQNSRDWTVYAFLKAESGGLGLEVAQDAQTQQAMARALVQLADTPVDGLRGRKLSAADFDHLLTSDPVRDLLRWLSDPAGTRASWGPEVWGAFRSLCKSRLGYDPQDEGELVGAERLGQREGRWAEVWSRFSESPRHYPGLPSLLRKAEPAGPADMFADMSAWPGENERQETTLRGVLTKLEGGTSKDARKAIFDLEVRHGMRRGWVWTELGLSPLARALEHLTELARVCSSALGGQTVEAMRDLYAEGGWQADAAVLQALSCVETREDQAAVAAAVRAVYLPWVEAAAERLQDLVLREGYPGAGVPPTRPHRYGKGDCILFSDGLRFDVAQALVSALEGHGMKVTSGMSWQGPPTVTATCKPAAAPIAPKVSGDTSDNEFVPQVAGSGESLTPYRFRKLLEESGYQVLGKEETGDPKGRAWCEHGDLDHTGHQEGARLVRRIPEMVRDLCSRVAELLDAGWKRVHVVTDHGWLLVPGGLPKKELPKYLAETRWGRCSLLKDSTASPPLVVPWRWCGEVRVAMPRGVSTYKASMEYAHGGLSLQECLVPELTVSRGAATEAAVTISELTWRGLRCRVTVDGGSPTMLVDLRTKPAVPGSSLAAGGKPLAESGKVSLVVEDDSAEGMAAVLVVMDEGGTVVAKMTTTVGGES